MTVETTEKPNFCLQSVPDGGLELAQCLKVSLSRYYVWLCFAKQGMEEVGKILYFPLPPAEDILPYETVINTELENCRHQALPWQAVSPGGWQTVLLL